jgi:hypothetical protein
MAKKPAASSKRVKWFSSTGAPLIDDYARRLRTFLEALADGTVDDHEVKDQEARLVKCMKEVEPLLDDAAHARVTRLLCELTAYDLMQILNAMHKSRPRVRFRG